MVCPEFENEQHGQLHTNVRPEKEEKYVNVSITGVILMSKLMNQSRDTLDSNKKYFGVCYTYNNLA